DYGSYHNEPIDPRSGIPDPGNFLFPYGILVNQAGQRFIDEAPRATDESYEEITHAITAQSEGIAYSVFDGKLNTIPNYERGIRTDQPPLTAESLDALAQKIGVNEASFVQTVTEYNAACAEGSKFD